ncbi:hypothetical protein [Dechloromonas denitrificans]|uniref:hypothetical protein n=1 Tax=Dechloromonas denitrificans TaxID=281362 RepID=UPI001CF8F5FF|nr:hypothetical protein [Dechloromonas denitrificans]UCV02958.1 hypothetical protein KI611_18055 [Dechloromonas denitrificans]
MTAIYKRLEFRTQLEARWAAFFDLAGWKWHKNPVPVNNWCPDFRVEFECDHSECDGSHSLLVAVLPISKIEEFQFHPCLSYAYGVSVADQGASRITEDGGAAFGTGPTVTRWEISHGSGGGVEDIYFRVPNADELWLKTEKLVATLP